VHSGKSHGKRGEGPKKERIWVKLSKAYEEGYGTSCRTHDRRRGGKTGAGTTGKKTCRMERVPRSFESGKRVRGKVGGKGNCRNTSLSRGHAGEGKLQKKGDTLYGEVRNSGT